MRVELERDRCCGAGMCVLYAPEVFDQDEEDGLVLLKIAEPPDSSLDAVRTAAGTCPNSVISIAG
ncbi:ferredoxin [Pseudonocardiaceae bacterium YIM PH 21723]|nr:ferredoxin [Pseudonocardiaceae bacterium YIM PH 21723]